MKTLKLSESEVYALKVALDILLALTMKFEDSDDETLREIYADLKRIREYLN